MLVSGGNSKEHYLAYSRVVGGDPSGENSDKGGECDGLHVSCDGKDLKVAITLKYW